MPTSKGEEGEGEAEEKEDVAKDPIPATSGITGGFQQRCMCLERAFRNIVVVCFAWNLIQGLLGFAIAICVMRFSGRIVNSIADDAFTQNLLSPLIPVWNDLGDALPFKSILGTFEVAMCMVSVTWCFIAVLCGVLLWKQNILRLWIPVTLGVVALAVFLFQFLLLVSPAAWNSMIFDQTSKGLVSLLRIKYKVVTRDAFSTVMNIIMVLGHCCGVEGPSDFTKALDVKLEKNIYSQYPYYRIEKLPAWPTSAKNFVAKVPPACCHNDVAFQSPDRHLERLMFCASGRNNESFYSMGCGEAYQKMWVKNLEPGFVLYFSLSALSLALLVVYCVICVICMCFKKEESPAEEEEAEQEVAAGAAEGDEEEDQANVDLEREASNPMADAKKV